MIRSVVATALSLLLLSNVANAGVITLEPDDFPEGTTLNTISSFVTLSIARNDGSTRPPGWDNVTAFSSANASTGVRVFGRQLAATTTDDSFFWSPFIGQVSVFRADFATPTNYSSIDVIPQTAKATHGILRAFDGSDALLETVSVPLGALGDSTRVSIDRPQADIAYILVSSVQVFTFAVVALDNFEFNLSEAALLQDLIDKVLATNLHSGIQNSLDGKLEAAVRAIDDLNVNNDVAAGNALYAFVSEVLAQKDKLIEEDDADELIASANLIINLLSAP